MPAIVFVCTGNTCRSPMAEVLFREQLRTQGLDEAAWTVESAGTWAPDGAPAARFGREVMAQRGLDLSLHRARTVTRAMLERFDLILVMEVNHKEALWAEFPDLLSKIYLLSEMVNQKLSVADPIAGKISDYQATALEIEAYLTRGWQRILELTQD